eukprot:CAMPEP_0184872070 /NCGR_PEP_ID=MMETSP0580-20130426/41079_1 /TAXON_ID=1118495 /ORGANISM="Dactyliosolen fragilissimus" /LENGTH=1068 /DNA_ID=CAMNT_0027374813 /DNA_START=913 /DNA_END=4119 /DNA_ORIENTATION=+
MAQGRTSGRKLPKRNSNHHSKSDLSINFAKNPSIQWELRELESLENDVDILWKESESLLGIQIDPMAFVTEAIESSTSDGKDGSWTSSSAKTTTIDKLIETEAIYKDLAVKLRRLIARWSTLHHDIMLQNNNTPSHILSDISNDLEFNEEDDFQEDEEVGEIDIEKYDDDDDDDDKLNVKDNYTDIDTDTVTKSTSKNQPHSDSFSRGNQYHDKSNKTNIPFHSNLHTISPADKAESYIEMLELLRNSRHFVIHDCISRGKKEQNKGTHKGILEWAKNIFTDKNYNSHISSQAKILTSSQANDPSTDKNIIEDVENLLTAHLSNDFVANTKLYKEAMICRIHWYSGPKSISNFTSNLNLISGGKNDFDAVNNEDGTRSSITENTNVGLIKPNSMYNENREIQSTGSLQPPKNSVLAQHLMNMLNRMSYHWSMGNMYARPDRECYHIVLGVCRSGRAKKFVDTTKAEILLNQMEKEVKMVNSHSNGFSSKIQTNHTLGVYPSQLYTKDHEPYTPNLQTYHLVLGAYENAIKLAKRNEKERQKYAFAAENILNCLVNKQRKRWNSEGNNDEEDLNFPPKPSLHTYQYVLSILNCAGHKALPDLCTRAENILTGVMGKEHFSKWVVEKEDITILSKDKSSGHLSLANDTSDNLSSVDSSLVNEILSDAKIHDIMVHMYSRSDDPRNFEKSKILLVKMMKKNRDSLFNRVNITDDEITNEMDADSAWEGFLDQYFPTPSIQKSNKSLTNNNSDYPCGWDTTCLRTIRCNHVLNGLEHSSLAIKKATIKEDKKSQLLENARFGHQLLDSMVESRLTMPDMQTFIKIMRLWGLSQSPEAGEMAEKLLARMEIHTTLSPLLCSHSQFSMFHRTRHDVHLNTDIYKNAIYCWGVSALSYVPSSAERAMALLDRVEAQIGPMAYKDVHSDKSNESNSNNFDQNDQPLPSLHSSSSFKWQNKDELRGIQPEMIYGSVISTCAKTRVEEDKPNALRIAFELYNRMIDRGFKPSWAVYANLLSCCELLPLSPPDKRMRLSSTVFEAACEHGRVDDMVLGVLRRVNEPLYNGYVEKEKNSK